LIYIYFVLFNILFSSQGDFYIENGLNNKDNLEVAQKYFKQAVDSYRKEENEIGLSDAYYYLGYTHELKSEYSDAIKLYNQSVDISKSNSQYKNELRSISRLSYIFSNLNIFDKSLYYLNRQNQILTNELNDDKLYNSYLYDLSNYYYSIKNNYESIGILTKIDSKSLNNLNRQYYNLFAINYQKLGNNAKAEEYYLKLYNLYPEHKIVLANISRFYYSINDIEKSQLYFEKLINAKPLPNRNDELVNQLLVSDLYFKLNDTQSSLDLLNEITPYFSERDIYDRYLEALILKKKIYFTLGKAKDVQELDSIIYEVKEKQVKTQIDVNSKVIYALNEIELENLAKEDEIILYKVLTYASVVLVLVLAILAFLIYKNRQIKIIFEDLEVDNNIKIHRTSSLVLFSLNNAINNFVRYMHLNYDFEDNLDLYENFEEIIDVNVELHKVVKDEPLESPLELNLDNN